MIFMDGNEKAIKLIRNKIKYLRGKVPQKKFDKNIPAEVEVNKFYFDGSTVDRIMVVLRANGCEHYKQSGGCSMCSHYNGVMANDEIVLENYIKQWDSVLSGSCFENKNSSFNLGNYPIVCIYNLGSLLNPNEVPYKALQYIFSTLNKYPGVRKVIIESRAEYINDEVLRIISNCYDGIVEVGIGVESTNQTIREICHNKGLEDFGIVERSLEKLKKFKFKSLAYVNFKPCFLTEKESVEDAIKTSVDCFKMGFDAVSIEPTSLQEYSLVDYLHKLGVYRVPWLWSLQVIVQGIYSQIPNGSLDIRLGGYFDEEILSGSQGEGFCDRNELFPHQTSSNCINCTNNFVDSIKKFNTTYDLNDLMSVDYCENCFEIWKAIYNIDDSRDIIQRVFDLFKCDFEE